MRISVGNRHKNDEDKIVNTVEINGETFYNIPNISDREKCRHCKLRSRCDYAFDCVRKLDCLEKQNSVKTIFNIITGIIIAVMAVLIYSKLNYSFFTETAVLICVLLIMDAFCCFLEYIVKVIRDNLFYKKLRKQKLQKEEILEKTKAENEEKKKKENIEAFIKEFENIKSNSDYNKIKLVKSYISTIERINSITFKSTNEQMEIFMRINSCQESLTELVDALEIDNSRYNNLIELFEIYLPDFYKTLTLYVNFIKENTVRPEHEKILLECIEKFDKYLEKSKKEITLERGSDEIQFRKTAESLSNLLNDEGDFEDEE